MKIIVTTAGSGVGSAIARWLIPRHDVCLLKTGRAHSVEAGGQGGADFSVQSMDLRGGDLDDICTGVDAIVHAANFDVPPAAEADRPPLLRATLGTYRLCTAAREAGVDRIIVAGSLNVFDTVPERYMVDEMWRPRPQPDCEHLVPYLAEQCAREFVREGPLRGISLRFLPPDGGGEATTPMHYILHAVDRALALEFHRSGHRWHVFHVAPGRRFLMRDAVRQLGFSAKEAESCRL